jgi:hypothetical protein
MELDVSVKILELDTMTLERVLKQLNMQDRDAFNLLKELIEDNS